MSGELLLIVEDNDILREGLVEILNIEGYHVISARHGKDALEKLGSLFSRPGYLRYLDAGHGWVCLLSRVPI